MDQATKFLLDLFEGIPEDWRINIGAIHPEKDSTEWRNWTLDQIRSNVVEEFIMKYNTDHNIHFRVNPSQLEGNKAAGKVDLAGIIHVHVDIDPPTVISDNWKSDTEQKLRDFDLPITIIDSGNGLQGIIRVSSLRKDEKEIELPPETADAELINEALATQFEGDIGATDASRLLRMPFTTNYPNTSKRAKGRVPCAAKLVVMK